MKRFISAMADSRNNLVPAEQILIDNGINESDAPNVLRAIGFALLDEDLYPYDDSDRSELMDEVDYWYNKVAEYDWDLAGKILDSNGANEDESGPDGFLTGVSNESMRKMIVEFQKALN